MAGDKDEASGGTAASAPATPPAAPPPASDDDGFVAKLRKVLPDLLDEILGKEEEGESAKAAPSAPRTDRQTEQSLRDQVAQAMKDLEHERAHAKDQAALQAPAAPPPQPEVKPWRQKFWGE